MRQGSFQLLEFVRRPVQFDSDEISYLQDFREQRADIVEMREHALGAFVAFPAEYFITVDAESVEEIFCFTRSFRHETPQRSFDRFEVPRVHFEVRMQADEV